MFYVALVSTGVGLVVATRRPRHPIGWLLLANGLVLAAIGIGGGVRATPCSATRARCRAALGRLLSERAWPLLFVC